MNQAIAVIHFVCKSHRATGRGDSRERSDPHPPQDYFIIALHRDGAPLIANSPILVHLNGVTSV
jgi:hypothetical protein